MRLIIILSVLSLLVSCGNKKEKAAETNTQKTTDNTVTLTDAQLKNAAVSIGSIESRNISSIIKVNGKIDVPPQNLVTVSMPLGGYLKSTKLLPGMHVKKGEVIAVLEDLQYIQLQQEYLTSKARLEMAAAEYNRQRDLNESKASSDKVFQQSRSEFKSLKIAVSALAEKLKLIDINPATLTASRLSRYVNLYSPINGFVSKVDVNIGKYLMPADVLFELVNPKDIHLKLKVFEKDLSQLSLGQQLVAYTNTDPERKHICEIILISKDIAPDRTAEVHCHFRDYDKSLLPGMYMNAEINVRNKNTYVIPEEAVVSFEGKDYLFIVTGKNTFEMLPADVGTKDNNLLEIKNYEQFAGKQIVVNGAYTLLMALKNTSEE